MNKIKEVKDAIKLALSEIKQWKKFLATARKRLKRLGYKEIKTIYYD